ncbi:MAG TPA: peptide-methionine (R)-S-oxide reductase MsrB [Candidatus Elarobacter sp.]|jgi:peptide-methionine (R)-S-oxide reductase|nr:peptide-methionine (R)-S-oxide reductase MsrB [Candidatus Elarobacter sp.]
MKRRTILTGLSAAFLARPLAARAVDSGRMPPTKPPPATDAEWRERLSPRAYQVLRQGETEPAFSSPLNRETRTGTYTCAGCAQPAFSSKTKYDAHNGYPSFTAPLRKAVTTTAPLKGKRYATVRCGRCDSHLGRLYHDGPKPTGLHYSMNGIALAFLLNSA